MQPHLSDERRRLHEHSQIAEVAVIGAADRESGERACVVARPAPIRGAQDRREPAPAHMPPARLAARRWAVAS